MCALLPPILVSNVGVSLNGLAVWACEDAAFEPASGFDFLVGEEASADLRILFVHRVDHWGSFLDAGFGVAYYL